ncbi:MAG: HDOD domain-containing protein [Nevskiaceae bacterium]|nr:MAG: HDOD domain-containing protein [Nevskiaceae bacterium]
MSRIEDRLMQAVREGVAQDRLQLPTLPEVALRIQRLARDESVSAARLAAEIGRDPATAARLLKIANSASQRALRAVDNLQMAIARIGMTLTCNLAIGLTVEQLFRARSPLIDRKLRAVWTRSQEVAAMAQVLAAHCTVLKPELALLAGLVHEIGVLPVLRIADEQFPEVAEDPAALERALAQLHPRTGALVLRVWNFPPEIVDVPMHHVNLRRDHDGPADYGDVITVACLQTHLGGDHPLAQVDRSTVPAFAKLDLSPEVDFLEIDGVQEQYDDNCGMLAA